MVGSIRTWTTVAGLLVSLVRTGTCFSGTYPVAIYSSSTLEARHLAHGETSQKKIQQRLEDFVRQCRYDSVVLVEHPGSHADDLRGSGSKLFHPTEAGRTQKTDYVYGHLDLDALHETIGRHCNPSSSSKNTLERWVLPELPKDSTLRAARVESMDDWLATKFETTPGSHLMIYAGVPRTAQSSNIIPLRKRQITPSPSVTGDVLPAADSLTAMAPSISPITSRSGIFKKYQLFTSDLILALLISFGLLLPIALIAVHSMASLKTPDRFEKPPNVGSERKQQ